LLNEAPFIVQAEKRPLLFAFGPSLYRLIDSMVAFMKFRSDAVEAMKIGVLKELKEEENRVGLLPVGVEMLVADGHEVIVESQSGTASGFEDSDYAAAGAHISKSANSVFGTAEMIVKVKEPLPEEYALLRKEQTLFTYFHFAASERLTKAFIKSGSIAIAYETVQLEDGSLPLLTPMSEVAGRMAIQQGAKYLEREYGGRGVLLGGVPGTPPGVVVILGGGVVGSNAARMAAGLGAQVLLLDVNLQRLRYLADVMPPNVTTLISNSENIRQALNQADVVVSSVLIPGERAPLLLRKEHLKTMKRGAVIVDVAIDQGGSTESSRPTSHRDPIYEVDGIIHYCVTNMPGALPMTSTIALTNATLPYILQIANEGWQQAANRNPAIAKGINIARGLVVHRSIAQSFNLPYSDWRVLL